MTPVFSLISSSAYIELPNGLVGWFTFFILAGLIGFLVWRVWELNPKWNNRHAILFAVLLLFVPITSLFVGFRLPNSGFPPPGIPSEPIQPAVMLFSAFPWALAGGILGPLPSVILAMVSGLLTAIFETHNLFTPLEIMLIAVLFSAAIRQPYRTLFFRLLRRPVVTTILLSLIFPFIHLAITPAITRGLFVSRLDYAITNLKSMTLAMGIELILAGLFVELIAIALPNFWQKPDSLIPSPAERSLNARFLFSMAPLGIALILTLMIGSWMVAGKAARDSLESEMANAAQLASENIPYFLETGQSIIRRIASDPALLSKNKYNLDQTLSELRLSVPFFNQLSVLDENGNLLASDPTSYYLAENSPITEQKGIELALSGVPFQLDIIPKSHNQLSAQVSFITTIVDENQEVKGVLIGRADPSENPISKPIITSLNNFTHNNGVGMLLDEDHQIIYHTDPTMVMKTYTGEFSDQSSFYDETAPDGTRMISYYQPAIGRSWAIVIGLPAYRAQQIALRIASPLLAMIAILAIFAIVLMRLGINTVTSSLQNLATEASRIAQGQLETPLRVEGVDEVGKLRRAFEKMRISLKARLDELNRLLIVSQGVASSLELSDAIQPVLEAALATGASTARIILTPTIVPAIEGDTVHPVCFGLGPSQNLYQDLDKQILAFTRQQERLVLPSLLRPRLLTFTPGSPHPESLLAVALHHENLYYGALWIAFDQPHIFSEEEVRFIATLGGQAALAVTNARLFMNAEIGRQRLAAILASSPDPVLVIDQSNRLLLANPAAWQVLGLGMDIDEGVPIDQIITQTDLLDLLRSNRDDEHSIEVTFPDGNIYLAAATQVQTEGQQVGRVCVMRDITHFKELDALKSEFVSTVSHDLRSPLTLMRGYATMLEMVGQLNDQQQNYVRKIITGVESMSRLVNNLLDLGRIEAGIGLQLEKVSVQDVIERVVGGLQLQATQRNIQLTAEVPRSIPLIEADQALLQQALQNLVENAVKYTRPDGKVHVEVKLQPIGVVFSIKDTGIGISPMDQPRLFERFFRGVQHASRDERGTGLGLAIVKSIADRHGGKVWADSQLGKGSIFYFVIPITQPRRESEQ